MRERQMNKVTRVVHLKRSGDRITQGCEIYIGGPIHRGGWDLPASKWYNPFSFIDEMDREKSLERYERYIRSNPYLVDCLKELEGKVLGCWCKPKRCHGDVLVDLLHRARLGEDILIPDEEVDMDIIGEQYADMPDEDFHRLMGAYDIKDYEEEDFIDHPEKENFMKVTDRVCRLNDSDSVCQLNDSDSVCRVNDSVCKIVDRTDGQKVREAEQCIQSASSKAYCGNVACQEPELSISRRLDHPEDDSKGEMVERSDISVFWDIICENDEEELGIVPSCDPKERPSDTVEGLQPSKELPRKGVDIEKLSEGITINELFGDVVSEKETLHECREVIEIENFNISSRGESKSLKELLYRMPEQDEEVPVWSLLTETIMYNNDHDKTAEIHLEKLEKNRKNNQERMEKLRKTAKEMKFRSDNSNEPDKGSNDRITKAKDDNFNADWNNIPKSTLEDRELDMRYEQVMCDVHKTFHPDRDVCATYLWSEETAESSTNASYNFKRGIIPITKSAFMKSNLTDEPRTPMRTLFDSGASKPIIRKQFYESNDFLKQHPLIKIKKKTLNTANVEKISITECVKLVVELSGHYFQFIAYVAELTNDVDFIVGAKALCEMEGCIDMGKCRVTFVMRSVDFYPNKDITLAPGEHKIIMCKAYNVPEEFTEGPAIIHMDTKRQSKTFTTHSVHLEKNKFMLKMENRGNHNIIFKETERMGSLDLRSMGYFHQSRTSLEFMMKAEDMAEFLSEEESADMIRKAIEHNIRTDIRNHEELSQNTKLYSRKDSQVIDELTEKEKTLLKVRPGDPYPWLDDDDPRRYKTDEELMKELIDLDEADLSNNEKRKFRKMLLKYREAFSLRDEIGVCPNMEVELALTDTTPFQLRPYGIKETNKAYVDKEMRKGVLLGILKKGLSSYSSPIMLIPRPGNNPRIVTDFRHLNSRLIRLNPSVPLIKDAIQTLGASECEVMSVMDLKDAYHTLRLSEWSKQFCGITPYYGSGTYLYQRLGMGLSVSPAIWQNFMNRVLDEMPDRRHHLAIMDDCLVHSKKNIHMKEIENLLKALINNGLKISPKKCQFYRKKLKYMGHTILIEDNVPHITAHKTRIDAIQDMRRPRTPRDCKRFCGMVIFLSMFLKDLQKHLIPIYELTKKNVKFQWGEAQENAFNLIKDLVTQPPVLVMPNTKDKFILFSDTSFEACGAALYQVQDGIPRLVAYHSKKLVETARRFSISELELHGLVQNIEAFQMYLEDTNFDVYVDHSALVHMMNGKQQPKTLRLKKLIETLQRYSFVIRYHKGKDMNVADCLSRNPRQHDSPQDPNEPMTLTPGDLNKMVNGELDEQAMMLWDKKIEEIEMEMRDECMALVEKDLEDRMRYKEYCMVMTRSQAKKLNIQVPSLFPEKKNEKSNVKEKEANQGDKIRSLDKENNNKKHVSFKKDLIQTIPRELEKEKLTINNQEQQDKEINIVSKGDPLPRTTNMIERIRPDNKIYTPTAGLDPIYQRPDKLYTQNKVEHSNESLATKLLQKEAQKQDDNRLKELNQPTIDINILGQINGEKRNSEVELERMMLTDKDRNREIRKLFTTIKNEKIMRRHLPRYKEVEKLIDVIKNKIIHNSRAPMTQKEMIHAYRKCPFFKDIYNYIEKGFVRFRGQAVNTFKNECEDYLICEGILYRIIFGRKEDEEPKLKMCIPEDYISLVIYQYHDMLLSGHQGTLRTYLTIRRRFWFPHMLDYINKYISSCLVCQSRSNKESTPRMNYVRIPENYRPMSSISIDCKYMPPSKMGYRYILLCTCEITNFVVAVVLSDLTSTTLFDALLLRVISIFGNPDRIISDEGSSLTGEVFQTLYKCFRIKPVIVSPQNHGSLRTERYIQTMNNMMCKHLEEQGEDWPLYVYPCTMAMNTFVSPRTGYSPYEMVFLHPPPDVTQLDYDPTKIKGKDTSVVEYMDIMKQRYNVIKRLAIKRRLTLQETEYYREQRQHPNHRPFAKGDLALFYNPTASNLKTPSKKLIKPWLGPVKIQGIFDKTHYLIADWDGKIDPRIIHENRLKPIELRFGKFDEGMTNYKTLKAALNRLPREESTEKGTEKDEQYEDIESDIKEPQEA